MVDLELNELKKEFLAEAEEKLSEIEAAFARAPEKSSVERLAYLAHQLKGSGGSYGYQRISAEAAEIEEAAEKLIADEAAARAEIPPHLTSLREEITRSLRDLENS